MSGISAGAGIVVFDTDVLIWLLRGNPRAARLLDEQDDRALSVVSFMELIEGARTQQEVRGLRSFLLENELRIVAVDEAMSHAAATLMEDHALPDGLSIGDAFVAATAREIGTTLATGNVRHFRRISRLQLRQFRP